MWSNSELNDFSEFSNDDEDVDVLQPMHAVSYCNLIILSTTLRHQGILATRFEDHF